LTIELVIYIEPVPERPNWGIALENWFRQNFNRAANAVVKPISEDLRFLWQKNAIVVLEALCREWEIIKTVSEPKVHFRPFIFSDLCLGTRFTAWFDALGQALSIVLCPFFSIARRGRTNHTTELRRALRRPPASVCSTVSRFQPLSVNHLATTTDENRILTAEEYTLIRWLLEHGEPRASMFVVQLSDVRVSGRCTCGCASIDLAVGGNRAPADVGMDILSDYCWRDGEHHLFGAFVFARGGLLAGLDLWSIDGQATATRLPNPSELKPVENTRNG
jgi:hypothetical protein